jgi:hypothetical protein
MNSGLARALTRLKKRAGPGGRCIYDPIAITLLQFMNGFKEL